MLIALIAAAAVSAPPDMVMLDVPVLTRAGAARLLGARSLAGGVVLRLDRSGRARIFSSTALARIAGVAAPALRREYALAYRPEARRTGRVALAQPTVMEGAALTLRSCVGVVVIERQVTALQQGNPRQAVFVRGMSGPAFAVPVAQVAP